MLSLGEYIYQEELNELMSFNINEGSGIGKGFWGKLKTWGNKFFNWLFKGNTKNNTKYSSNDEWGKYGYGLAKGFDETKNPSVKDYFNNNFDMENLLILKDTKGSSKVENLLNSSNTRGLFKKIKYKESLKNCNLIYILNKDDNFHILEQTCGVVFYNIENSKIFEAESTDSLNNETEKNGTGTETENNNRIFIKLFYFKPLYFKLNENLAKKILEYIFKEVKKQIILEPGIDKKFFILQLPKNDTDYEKLIQFFDTKKIDKKIDEQLDVVQYKLSYD